ncbi:TPA: YggS family pyridoxal phosphate-dependent enzyme [Streptococcus suis]|nr:YggS family pyridoxal phosphate-dependent enzyme [Streptococcus suis]
MDLQKNRDAVFSAVEEATQKAQRPKESVNVIAVTKYVDSSITNDLIKTGITHIGENRVDKFLDKFQALSEYELTWHLIGTLQRRKVKDVINYVDYFHALDSVKLAAEINKRAKKTIKCFLQLNIAEEESKHGFSVSEIDNVLLELVQFEKIELVGIMTMAPIDLDSDGLMDLFGKTHKICKELAARNLPRMPFTELSMGMSGDFEEAIIQGSTFVRIGSAFFKK